MGGNDGWCGFMVCLYDRYDRKEETHQTGLGLGGWEATSQGLEP